jgi:hypothetical protein
MKARGAPISTCKSVATTIAGEPLPVVSDSLEHCTNAVAWATVGGLVTFAQMRGFLTWYTVLKVGGPDISAAEPFPAASAPLLLQPASPATNPARRHSAVMCARDKVIVISFRSRIEFC